jgi:hypothetical protein
VSAATTTPAATRAEVELMAHLIRRAGFGARRDELDTYCAAGYEATVEALLNPQPDACDYGDFTDHDLVDRYFTASWSARGPGNARPHWGWRMLTSPRPLEEKIALFWHGVFATGGTKFPLSGVAQLEQIDMFRRYGLGRFETLLGQQLSRDPAMLYWLDNQHNHRDAPNENYGRELLELFSLGVGNYTEADVKAAARAFTGWTITPMHSLNFLGIFPVRFVYDATDHDDGEKTFLGYTGRFDGDDIVRILAAHPAAARFVCGRLYRFFVADTPNEAEIDRLAGVFTASDGEIRAVLRAIFTSPHFAAPAVRYRRVKSPVELVFGTARLTDRFPLPHHDVTVLGYATHYMGQSLLNPPSVEGWHDGEEWIDSACLMERINFAAAEIGRRDAPGIRRILDRVAAAGPRLPPDAMVDACLDALGALAVSARTRAVLVEHVGDAVDAAAEPDRVVTLLQAVVATPDYQYC